MELQVAVVVVAFTPHVGPAESEYLKLFGKYLLLVVGRWWMKLVEVEEGVL